MRIYAALIYLFLYFPIMLIVGFSFNAGRYAMDWQGFSFFWYGKAFSNPLIVEALETSLFVALSTAFLSAVIGTMTALGLERITGLKRTIFDALLYIAIMVPGIVIGISTLIAFVTLFGIVNPFLQSAWNMKIEMGIWTVVAAHVLFNLAVVCLLVRAQVDRHGSQPGRGLGRSLRHAHGHVPSGGFATADAIHTGGLSPVLHLFV